MHYSGYMPQLLVSTTFLSPVARAAYALAEDYSGAAFFQGFEFFTDADPTNGHVKYVSLPDANSTGLAGLMSGGNATKAIYMGVDTSSVAPDGRKSVRVSSAKSYQHALVVADIVHMPGSVCGILDGEIDIVEGVNDRLSNQMTLHSTSGPRIAHTHPEQQGLFTGEVITTDCNVNAPDQTKNAGCAIADTSNLTFGATFNANGGGVYATEWTSDFIKIWFFPRGKFPIDIASANPSPSENWGPPTSMFTGAFKMDDHFRDLKIVFDTTFCGDWAGNTWNDSSCAALAPTCEDYVANNPAAFTEAYWAVNTLQVFQDDGTPVATGDKNGAGQAPVFGGPASTPGNGLSRGMFVKNAAVGDLAAGRHIKGQTQQGKATTPMGKWVQPPGGWSPRKKTGGAVLPPRV